jgi:hypothetical protein
MEGLKRIEELGYRPDSFDDFILIEIYKKLCDIESKIQVAVVDTKTVTREKQELETNEPEPQKLVLDEAETKAKNKICKHCGEVHEKPVEYALCAKKYKKEGV